MGAWSPGGATGWCGTPGLVANDNGLAVEACGGDRPVNRQAARLGPPAVGQPVQEQPTSRAREEPAMRPMRETHTKRLEGTVGVVGARFSEVLVRVSGGHWAVAETRSPRREPEFGKRLHID